MNRFGTLMAWAQGFMNHTALPAIASFIASIMHDELDVATALVAKIIDSVPADLAADKPLVALGAIASAAAEQAKKDGIAVGTNALAVASANAVAVLAGTVPVTQVDASGAINDAANKRDQAIAAANAAFEAEQKVLTDAADKAASDLAAKVSN
jgi:hypothetical protein